MNKSVEKYMIILKSILHSEKINNNGYIYSNDAMKKAVDIYLRKINPTKYLKLDRKEKLKKLFSNV